MTIVDTLVKETDAHVQGKSQTPESSECTIIS